MTHDTTDVSFWTLDVLEPSEGDGPDADRFLRVTLADGDTYVTSRNEQHDEGYSSEWTAFWREGDMVYCKTETDSRDCDGRFSTSSTCACHISHLAAYVNPHTGVAMPEWEQVGNSQRDYSAEAAGY